MTRAAKKMMSINAIKSSHKPSKTEDEHEDGELIFLYIGIKPRL